MCSKKERGGDALVANDGRWRRERGEERKKREVEKKNKTGKSLAEGRAAEERKSVVCFDDATGRKLGEGAEMEEEGWYWLLLITAVTTKINGRQQQIAFQRRFQLMNANPFI
jgi:hypothetical protein